ncbi:MAG: hypothetical protein ABWZ19_03020 [Hyphomicrobium sp.]
MDLKAASDQNSTADFLTRAGMAVCFVATGALLIGTLMFDQSHAGLNANLTLTRQVSPQ